MNDAMRIVNVILHANGTTVQVMDSRRRWKVVDYLHPTESSKRRIATVLSEWPSQFSTLTTYREEIPHE